MRITFLHVPVICPRQLFHLERLCPFASHPPPTLYHHLLYCRATIPSCFPISQPQKRYHNAKSATHWFSSGHHGQLLRSVRKHRMVVVSSSASPTSVCSVKSQPASPYSISRVHACATVCAPVVVTIIDTHKRPTDERKGLEVCAGGICCPI